MCPGTKKEEARPMIGARNPAKYDLLLNEMGHKPVTHGGVQICLECGDSRKNRDRRRIAGMGSCRGYNPWQVPPDLYKPWKCEPDVPIAYMGKVIHPSHSVKFLRVSFSVLGVAVGQPAKGYAI